MGVGQVVTGWLHPAVQTMSVCRTIVEQQQSNTNLVDVSFRRHTMLLVRCMISCTLFPAPDWESQWATPAAPLIGHALVMCCGPV